MLSCRGYPLSGARVGYFLSDGCSAAVALCKWLIFNEIFFALRMGKLSKPAQILGFRLVK